MSISVGPTTNSVQYSLSTGSVTTSYSPTPGSTLLVLVSTPQSLIGSPLCTDDQGNTYTGGLFFQNIGINGSLTKCYLFRADNVIGGTPVTISVSVSNLSPTSFVLSATQIIGLSPNPLDVSTSTLSTGSTSPTSGTVTTNFADELLVGFMCFDNSQTTNITGPGWSVLYENGGVLVGNELLCSFVATEVVTAGLLSASWTLNRSSRWSAGIVAYKAASPIPFMTQSSQRWDDLPNLWWEYGFYKQQPFDTTFVPPRPPSRQSDQRSEQLPLLSDIWYRQHYIQPIPISYFPTAPQPRQANQVQIRLPDIWQEWDAFTQRPYAQWFAAPKAPTRQSSQRFDVLPEYDDTIYRQQKKWPVPVQFIPPVDSPLPRQSRIDYTAFLTSPDVIYWQQYGRLVITPSSFSVSQEGISGIYGLISAVCQTGSFRIQNDIEGYNVYIGSGALPDLTQVPASFSKTLPLSVALTPPLSGTRTFYVLVTFQDTYGLQSQNQNYTQFTIDSSGNLVISPITSPQGLQLFEEVGGYFRVLAYYPGFGLDKYPATKWKIWVGLTSPNPLVDTPALVTSVIGKVLTASIGPLAPGTYSCALALYRDSDGFQSPALSGTVVIDSPPPEPTAVFSGFDSQL